MGLKQRLKQIAKKPRGALTLALFGASTIATVGLVFAALGASAANANFRVDPSTQNVQPGDEFVVNIVHNADVGVTGVETNLLFDPTKLEVVGIDKGTDWDISAALFLGVAPQTREEAIADANTTGVMRNIARYFSPGLGTVAPGPKIAAIVTFRAKPGAALGAIPLSLEETEALDIDYSGIPTSRTNGSVTIGDDPTPTTTVVAEATATPTVTATATETATSTATATGTLAPATPTSTPTVAAPSPTPTDTPGTGVPGSLSVQPQFQEVPHGTTFEVAVIQDIGIDVSGVQVDFKFDPALIQVSDVVQGSGYPSGILTVGENGEGEAAAIAEANSTGIVRMILLYSDETVNPGANEVFRVQMQGRSGVSGVSTLSVINPIFYAAQPVAVTRVDGAVQVIGLATATPPPSFTPTLTNTPTATNTPAATSTPGAVTNTPTVTFTPTRTNIPEAPTNTPTKTNTPVSSSTPLPSSTPQPTATAGGLGSVTPLATDTPLATATLAAGTTPTVAAGTTPTVEAAASPTTAAAASATTAAVEGTPTVDPASAQAKINISPSTVTAPPGAEFTIVLVQDAPFVTTGAETDLKFDPQYIQVVSVEKSAEYEKASLLGGVAPQKMPDAIAEANTTGLLKNIATFFVPGSGSIPAGQAEFLRIKLKAKDNASDTTTALSLADMEMLNQDGEPLTVASTGGQVTIQAGAAVPTPIGSTSTVAGSSSSPGTTTRLPNAGKSQPYGDLNWALTISLIAMLASGAALVGSLARKEE